MIGFMGTRLYRGSPQYSYASVEPWQLGHVISSDAGQPSCPLDPD
jgi:hypothetical protein